MICVLCEDPDIPDEVMDPLLPSCYYGESRSLISELESRLSHSRPIFKNSNAAVHVKIEEASRGASVYSTIKSFSRSKDRRGTFQALINNHASDVKCHSISKKRLKLFQTSSGRARLIPFRVMCLIIGKIITTFWSSLRTLNALSLCQSKSLSVLLIVLP